MPREGALRLPRKSRPSHKNRATLAVTRARQTSTRSDTFTSDAGPKIDRPRSAPAPNHLRRLGRNLEREHRAAPDSVLCRSLVTSEEVFYHFM